MKALKGSKNFIISEAETFLFKFEDKPALKEPHHQLKKEFEDLQYKLYAEGRRSVLIILQGMDASGKDGLIKHLMDDINPQGITVTSFKHPSALELSHNFIWRHQIACPEKGKMAIFNRSHYENVLISRVHPDLVLAEKLPLEEEAKRHTEKFWEHRYDQINQFEKTLEDQGTKVIKFFLHLSKAEQRERFLERIENREKHWKFNADDIIERKYWKEYQKAYEKCIQKTSPSSIPWYILPADDKKLCRYLALEVIVEELKKMKFKFPPLTENQNKLLNKACKLLK